MFYESKRIETDRNGSKRDELATITIRSPFFMRGFQIRPVVRSFTRTGVGVVRRSDESMSLKVYEQVVLIEGFLDSIVVYSCLQRAHNVIGAFAWRSPAASVYCPWNAWKTNMKHYFLGRVGVLFATVRFEPVAVPVSRPSYPRVRAGAGYANDLQPARDDAEAPHRVRGEQGDPRCPGACAPIILKRVDTFA